MHWKATAALLVSLGLVVGAVPASSQQERVASAEVTAPAPVLLNTVFGKISKRSDGAVSMTTAGRKPQRIDLLIASRTKVLVDGKPSDASKLAAGDSVVVSYAHRPSPTISPTRIEAHHYRAAPVEAQLDPTPLPLAEQSYPYCPNVGSGGTVSASKTPCYCKACGGAGSGMIW